MNGVDKYSFADVDTVSETIPINTTINKKGIKRILENVIKRIIDIIGGLIGTIILIPLSIFIYIARKILNEDE